MSAEERKKHDHVTSPAHIATARSAASQRRHELFNNALVTKWQKFVEALKEGPSRTTWIVGGVVAAAILLYFVWHYFSKSSEEKNSARWMVAMRVFGEDSATAPVDEKTPLLSPEAELEKMIKDNPGTTQARIARFYLARRFLAKGEKDLGSKRDTALEDVRKAAELYEKLQADSSDAPVLHQESILRAGKAREMAGDFGKAVDHYNLLIKDYPKSAFLDEAKAGAERLKDGSSTRKELEALNASLNRKGG